VVLTGIPIKLTARITQEALASAANPWTGFKGVISKPTVRMMRNPPEAVPIAIISAQEAITQKGIYGKVRKPTHPGVILDKDYIKLLNLNVQKLAERLGISRTTLFNIRAGRAKVTSAIAVSLAEDFDTTPQLWLNLQQNYDLLPNCGIKKSHQIAEAKLAFSSSRVLLALIKPMRLQPR
jgi:addiction module HigA family antidote